MLKENDLGECTRCHTKIWMDHESRPLVTGKHKAETMCYACAATILKDPEILSVQMLVETANEATDDIKSQGNKPVH